MAFQGNAFALLEGDDDENLLARVSTAALTAAPPSSAVDKRSRNNKKPPASSSQSSSAPQQLSLGHEKGRYNRNGLEGQDRNGVASRNNGERQNSNYRNGVERQNFSGVQRQNRNDINGVDRQNFSGVERQNRNGVERQNKNGVERLNFSGVERQNRNDRNGQSRNSINGYNRDGVQRQNRNGGRVNAGHENNYQQNNRGGHVYKRNDGYRHDERPSNGLKRSEASSNGHQRKEEAANGDRNGHKKKEAANGDSNGNKKEKSTDEDGWQTVVRSNSRKQLYWQAKSEGESNVEKNSEEINNGNGSEDKVLEDKHQYDESGKKVVSGDSVEKLNGNASKDETKSTAGSVSGKDEGIEGDETSSKEADSRKGKQEKVLMSKEEKEKLKEKLEREEKLAAKKLEEELDAKRMTLKQYEKQLEEKRKVLESLKTEERRVALDKDFTSMHVIAKKKEEAANFLKLNSSASDKLKKKVSKNKDVSKVKKIVLCPPPTAGRGGRYPRREDDRNDVSSGSPEGSGNGSDTVVGEIVVCKAVRPPPSFGDAKQFPALKLDGSGEGK